MTSLTACAYTAGSSEGPQSPTGYRNYWVNGSGKYTSPSNSYNEITPAVSVQTIRRDIFPNMSDWHCTPTASRDTYSKAAFLLSKAEGRARREQRQSEVRDNGETPLGLQDKGVRKLSKRTLNWLRITAWTWAPECILVLQPGGLSQQQKSFIQKNNAAENETKHNWMEMWDFPKMPQLCGSLASISQRRRWATMNWHHKLWQFSGNTKNISKATLQYRDSALYIDETK